MHKSNILFTKIVVSKKEDGSSFYFYRKVLKLYCSTYCPSNIYTLSDEVIAAVFAINSSAARYQAVEDADIARVLGRGHDLHLPPSSRPRTLANDCVSVSAWGLQWMLSSLLHNASVNHDISNLHQSDKTDKLLSIKSRQPQKLTNICIWM